MLDDCLRQLDLGNPRTAGLTDLRKAMAECHTPGVSIALVEGGKITETRHEGVREVGSTDAITAHTLFQAGSISKSVAAACALRLVADGVLDLDDDVNDRLRSWRIPANDGWQPRVTLRHLLAHTGGTTVGGFIGYPQGTAVPSVPDVLDGHGNSMPVVVAGLPGLRWEYSGGGYAIMQQLLIDATGRDFPSLAAELVLAPAGMVDSTFAQPLPAALAGRAATGHHPGPVAVPGRWHTYPESAAAGLWSTATDLARFFLAIQASVAGARGALLPQSIAEQMVTPALPGARYGLGLELAGPGEPASIGHSGNDQGFENHAIVFTGSGRGMVMMTNAFYGKVLIHGVVVPAVQKAYGWVPDEPVRTSAAGSGQYGAFQVQVDGDDLILTYGGQQPVRLAPAPDGQWQAQNVNIDAWFEDGTLVVRQDGDEVRQMATDSPPMASENAGV